MSREPVSRFIKLVKVWKDRYEELGAKDFIDYVFIFENRGEEVGVTLQHPHGQIYAYPFIPPKIKRELDSSREYLKETGQCLFCSVLEEEVQDGRRIVAANDSFTAFVPFYARYPYEVHVYSNEHLPSLKEFREKEIEDWPLSYGQLYRSMTIYLALFFPILCPFISSPLMEAEKNILIFI